MSELTTQILNDARHSGEYAARIIQQQLDQRDEREACLHDVQAISNLMRMEIRRNAEEKVIAKFLALLHRTVGVNTDVTFVS